jgi:hypothetical protein
MVVRIAAASDGVPCATPKRIAYLERWLPIAAESLERRRAVAFEGVSPLRHGTRV